MGSESKNNMHIIKGKRCSDGFSFQVSIQHLIEQTLLRQYNSPMFKKSTILIEDVPDDESHNTQGSPQSDYRQSVPIKLQIKRKYAEEFHGRGEPMKFSRESYDQYNSDQPLDMTIKKSRNHVTIKEDKDNEMKMLDPVSPIPLSWVMRGLTRKDHKQFQNSIASASMSPYQRRKAALGQSIPQKRIIPEHFETANPSEQLSSGDLKDSQTETSSSSSSPPVPPPHSIRQIDLIDREFIKILSSIKNDPPTQKPVLVPDQYSEVKITDLMGSVIEAHLRKGQSSTRQMPQLNVI